MVFSTSAFGAYFKLTQGGPSNSSHVDLLAPVSMEPAGVGLAWLAVGSMCLFIAGEWGGLGEGEGAGFLWLPARPGLPALTSASAALTVYQAPS